MLANETPLDEAARPTGLSLGSAAIGYLQTAGKWGRFVSITGIVVSILLITGIVIVGVVTSIEQRPNEIFNVNNGMLSVLLVYVIILALMLVSFILLYQFSSNAVRATKGRDAEAATKSFRALAKIFQIGGFLATIYVVIIGLVVFANAMDLMREFG